MLIYLGLLMSGVATSTSAVTKGEIMRTNRQRLRAVAMLAGVALAAGACGGAKPDGGAKSAAATAATAAPSSEAAGGCAGGVVAGKDGVLRVFCDGTARATVSIGSLTKQLVGGQCTETSGVLAINFGAAAGPDYPAAKPKPDYLGLLVPDGTATVEAPTVRIDGRGGNVAHNTATVAADRRSLHLSGALLAGDPVSVDVTC
jgi:hypothetical protein